MIDKFFLDTNIFIYSLDRLDARKQQIADSLVFKALDTGDGVVSFQVVQEFFNVALKRMATPMTLESAEHYLARVFMRMLGVYPSHALFSEALRLHATTQKHWYDALIVSAARSAGCSVLYSEDLQHGQRFGSLRVVNPFV
jgi:predicted nucleic acid-binding protein